MVRLIEPHEQRRWDQLVSLSTTYLKNAKLVGERLCWTWWSVGVNGWRCWAGQRQLTIFGGARPMDQLDRQPTTRSPAVWVANNARFCLLTQRGQYPNLASRAMALNLARLSEDWQQAYGHPVVLAESFVDSQLFRGTAYKASGWREVEPEFRLQTGGAGFPMKLTTGPSSFTCGRLSNMRLAQVAPTPVARNAPRT